MRTPGSKWLFVAVVVLAVGAQAALAGVAAWSRRATESDLARERAVTASYAMQLAVAVQPPTPTGQTMPPPVLLSGPDVAGTLRAVQTVSDAVGVTLLSAKASRSSTPGRQTFAITGRGALAKVCAFVAGLEQHQRLMVVESGKVVPATADEVSFELGLSTYHAGGAK